MIFIIILKLTNLAISFLLELSALGMLSYWGFHTGKSNLIAFGLGVGTPILIAIIWGAFVAPAAAIPVSGSIRLTLVILIFGIAAVAFYTAGKQSLAILFILIAVLNRALIIIWHQ